MISFVAAVEDINEAFMQLHDASWSISTAHERATSLRIVNLDVNSENDFINFINMHRGKFLMNTSNLD